MPIGPPRPPHCAHFTRFEVLSPRFGPTSQIFTFFDTSFLLNLRRKTARRRRPDTFGAADRALRPARIVRIVTGSLRCERRR
jgi:hypothetical protein